MKASCEAAFACFIQQLRFDLPVTINAKFACIGVCWNMRFWGKRKWGISLYQSNRNRKTGWEAPGFGKRNVLAVQLHDGGSYLEKFTLCMSASTMKSSNIRSKQFNLSNSPNKTYMSSLQYRIAMLISLLQYCGDTICGNVFSNASYPVIDKDLRYIVHMNFRRGPPKSLRNRVIFNNICSWGSRMSHKCLPLIF